MVVQSIYGMTHRFQEVPHDHAITGHIEAVSETFNAEAYACLHVVQYTIDAGVHKVEVETDCLTLKTVLSSNAYDAAEGGTLVREIKFLLATNFVDIKVIHCPRTCNKVAVAHKLASMGASLGEGNVSFWPDIVPNDVISLVAADLTSA
jgi:hypothetical protein